MEMARSQGGTVILARPQVWEWQKFVFGIILLVPQYLLPHSP